MCIVINGKSQNCETKHLSCDELLYYKFVVQFAGKFFLIYEHLAKLHAKLLIVSDLDFCFQGYRTRQISK